MSNSKRHQLKRLVRAKLKAKLNNIRKPKRKSVAERHAGGK